jgi:ABC-type nitrate/sulfonate/bicarbonate transport system permease component
MAAWERRTFLLGAYRWYALGILLSAAVWELAAMALGPYRLPSLETVALQLFPLLTSSKTLEFQGGGSQGYWPHLLHTIAFTLFSSLTGVVTGVAFGLAMARFKPIRAISEVPIELLRTIPPLAAVPFILIWIGPGDAAQIMMVSYYVFVIMVITTLNATINVNPVVATFAATLGAKENRIFRTVIFPAMLPTVVGGVRVAVGIAWSVQIVAELMGGRYGMGRAFSAMISFQALDAIIVGIIWLALIAAIVDAVLVVFIRRVTRWAPTTRKL